jgi:hypothetical protein
MPIEKIHFQLPFQWRSTWHFVSLDGTGTFDELPFSSPPLRICLLPIKF